MDKKSVYGRFNDLDKWEIVLWIVGTVYEGDLRDVGEYRCLRVGWETEAFCRIYEEFIFEVCFEDKKG